MIVGTDKLLKAIETYAEAYRELDDLQVEEDPRAGGNEPTNQERQIPRGDQKTGAIGEFYVLSYLRLLNRGTKIKVILSKNLSQKGYDIVLQDPNGRPIQYISVKTVSKYANKLKTSPIKKVKLSEEESMRGLEVGLHIITLSKELKPIGYWTYPNVNAFLNTRNGQDKTSLTVSETNMEKLGFEDDFKKFSEFYDYKNHTFRN